MVITIKTHVFKRNYYQFGKTSSRPNNGLTFTKGEICVNFLCGGSSGNINKFTSIADTPRVMREWFNLYEIDGEYDFEELTKKIVSGEISEIRIFEDHTIKVGGKQ